MAEAGEAAAVTQLGERMRPLLPVLLPEEESTRSSTDATLLRWIRANEGNVDEASKGMMKYIQWYTQKPQYGEPEGVSAVAWGKGAELVASELATRKAFVVSGEAGKTTDSSGRPVIIIQVRHHDPSAEEYTVEKLTLFAVYLIESACAAMVAPAEQLCVVFDLFNIAYANVDMKAVKRILYLLTNMYPERLGVCILLDAPGLFSACWKVISPMLRERTRAKVKFSTRAELGDLFAPDSAVMAALTLSESEVDAAGEPTDPAVTKAVADGAGEAPLEAE